MAVQAAVQNSHYGRTRNIADCQLQSGEPLDSPSCCRESAVALPCSFRPPRDGSQRLSESFSALSSLDSAFSPPRVPEEQRGLPALSFDSPQVVTLEPIFSPQSEKFKNRFLSVGFALKSCHPKPKSIRWVCPRCHTRSALSNLAFSGGLILRSG